MTCFPRAVYFEKFKPAELEDSSAHILPLELVNLPLLSCLGLTSLWSGKQCSRSWAEGVVPLVHAEVVD